MSSPITRPVLRYHGGKWILAPWIISHFPPHRIYCEPFGGAASVLMRKPRAYAEVYNDLDAEVVNIFRVLRDPKSAKKLKRHLELTPFSRVEFKYAYEKATGSVERARKTIIRSYMGFGSASLNAGHSTGFRYNSNRSGTTPAHDWANYPGMIDFFTERLTGVVIEKQDALKVIKDNDGQGAGATLMYVDPPYPHHTRARNSGVRQKYRHEMTDDKHRELTKVLHSVKSMVVLSGYPCDLYDKELYAGWRRVETESMADGARKRIEVLYINPAAADALQPALFSPEEMVAI